MAELHQRDRRAEAALGTELRLRGGQRDRDGGRAHGSGVKRDPVRSSGLGHGAGSGPRDGSRAVGPVHRLRRDAVRFRRPAARRSSRCNYAFGRLQAELPRRSRRHAASGWRCSPASPIAGDERDGACATSIRLYADSAVALPATDSAGELQLAAGSAASGPVRAAATPWPLADGFVAARRAPGRGTASRCWTRESALPLATELVR